MSRQLMRHRVDVWSVLQVAATLAVQFAAFAFHWHWLVVLPIILLARQVNLVEHNHAHLRVFYNRHLNDALGWMCFLSNGVPLEFYELHHVKNHHQHNNGPDDWSSMFGFSGTQFPDRPIGRAYYVLTFPLITIAHSLVTIARAPGSRVFWRFLTSAAVISTISLALISIDPLGFVTFFLVPWVVLFFGLGFTNYGHHYGCAFTTPHDSSNVMTRLPFGLLGFNIGYHVSHHMKPALHWSLLPAHHASIQELIPMANYRPRRARATAASGAPDEACSAAVAERVPSLTN